jgi:phage tail protein X
MGKDTSDIRAEIADARADLGDTVDALAYKSDVKARVTDAVDERVGAVKQRVADTIETVKGSISGAVSEGVERADVMQAQAASTFGSPLGLVGGAFALAFLAGLLIPVSDMERRRVGPLRDAVVDRAQDAAHDAIARGKRMVTEAAASAMAK